MITSYFHKINAKLAAFAASYAAYEYFLRYYKSPFSIENTSFILELLAASTASLVPMRDV